VQKIYNVGLQIIKFAAYLSHILSKLSPKQWILLAFIQATLGEYFFSNLQTFLIYQNLPSNIFGKVGFHHFILLPLFSDALLFLSLSLVFLENNYLNILKFLTAILILVLMMSLSLSLSGQLQVNYLIYLTIIWFLLSNASIGFYLNISRIFQTLWVGRLIAISVLFIIWLVVPLSWIITPTHQIPNETKALLLNLQHPLEIKAFISDTHPLKKRLVNFLKDYHKIQQFIKASVLSPSVAPAQIQAFSITQEGELLLQYEDHFKRVEKLTDEAFTRALLDLLHAQKTQLVFLEGHGERSLTTHSPFEVSYLNTLFQNQSVSIRAQPFPPEVDRQTVLVIAHPRQPLNYQENQLIIKYLNQGGNLLWLIEPALENDGLSGLNQVANFLGLKLLDGYISNEHNNLIEISQILTFENMQGLSAIFPEVAALQLENSLFKTQLFLSTSNAFLKSFNNKKLQENQSILNFGFRLERVIHHQIQRIVIIGDSDFMSNAYIEKQDNAKLTSEIINWLTETPALIKVTAQKFHDTQLALDFYLQMSLTGFFLFILPMIFIIIAYRQKQLQKIEVST
jgi:hypothetical protein